MVLAPTLEVCRNTSASTAASFSGCSVRLGKLVVWLWISEAKHFHPIYSVLSDPPSRHKLIRPDNGLANLTTTKTEAAIDISRNNIYEYFPRGANKAKPYIGENHLLRSNVLPLVLHPIRRGQELAEQIRWVWIFCSEKYPPINVGQFQRLLIPRNLLHNTVAHTLTHTQSHEAAPWFHFIFVKLWFFLIDKMIGRRILISQTWNLRFSISRSRVGLYSVV